MQQCQFHSGDDGGLADPTVFLSIGNDIDISNRIIYIDMISEEEVGGFQFLLSDTPDNITITGAGGGITEESGFSISSSEMGPYAENYNPEANTSNDSCEYGPLGTLSFQNYNYINKTPQKPFT